MRIKRENIKNYVQLLTKTYREEVDCDYVTHYWYDYEIFTYRTENKEFISISPKDLEVEFNDNDWNWIHFYITNRSKWN